MRIRSIVPRALAAGALLAAPTLRADVEDPRTTLERFESDPTIAHGHRAAHGDGEHRLYTERGDAAAFAWAAHSRKHFDGDSDGSLTAVFDSNAPAGRYYTTFTGRYTDKDDFVFGAAFTIRPDALHADPDGASSIAFGLFDAKATGDDRTGDVNNPASNSFDSVEVDYFPNKSTLFGGPYFCPTVLGDAVGGDAFLDIAFGCAEVELTPGVPYFAWVEHSASNKTLTARLYRLGAGDPVEVEAARTTVDLSPVSGFHVDSFGVSSYTDGYSSFTSSGQSLYAVTDWDLLVAGPSGADDEVREALHRLELPGAKK